MMLLLLISLLTVVVLSWVAWQLRRRGLDRWLVSYLLAAPKRRAPLLSSHANTPPSQGAELGGVRDKGRAPDTVHLILCVADHFEPDWGYASPGQARERVQHWAQEYPIQFGNFTDSDGRPPRHTFFYPLETYDSEHLETLAELCRLGFGEVEVHLHHDHDTSEALREKLLNYKELLADRHGLLARRRQNGELAYGFIHGNWALDNSRPDGRWCGVNDELDVLRKTGCYADFTLPSAPSLTQTRKINSIYYACDDPLRPKSHDWGADVGTVPAPPHALMLIQGPLLLDWKRRKLGLVPRIENGCLQANQLPTMERLHLWLKARVQVPTRPDWFFVKLHTHGAKEANMNVLLGPEMVSFHRALTQTSLEATNFHFHYVTAREMYNLARAAEAGWQGSVADALNFELTWNGSGTPAVASLEERGERRIRAKLQHSCTS